MTADDITGAQIGGLLEQFRLYLYAKQNTRPMVENLIKKSEGILASAAVGKRSMRTSRTRLNSSGSGRGRFRGGERGEERDCQKERAQRYRIGYSEKG